MTTETEQPDLLARVEQQRAQRQRLQEAALAEASRTYWRVVVETADGSATATDEAAEELDGALHLLGFTTKDLKADAGALLFLRKAKEADALGVAQRELAALNARAAGTAFAVAEAAKVAADAAAAESDRLRIAAGYTHDAAVARLQQAQTAARVTLPDRQARLRARGFRGTEVDPAYFTGTAKSPEPRVVRAVADCYVDDCRRQKGETFWFSGELSDVLELAPDGAQIGKPSVELPDAPAVVNEYGTNAHDFDRPDFATIDAIITGVPLPAASPALLAATPPEVQP